MVLFVRFRDGTDKCVNVTYHGSTLLGHCRQTHWHLNDFVGMTKDLKSECLHQISVDGSTVNMKFFQEFSRMRIIIHLSNQSWKIWMDLEETYLRSICDFLQHLIKKRRLQKHHMSFSLSSQFLPSYVLLI